MKNMKVQILKFSFCCLLLVEHISETIRGRVNPPILLEALGAINSMKNLLQNWMKNKNSFYLPNIKNFGI
jgi:hypothetical protein